MVDTRPHLSEVLQKVYTTFIQLLLVRKVANSVGFFLLRLHRMPMNRGSILHSIYKAQTL
jgi:hypothetical protein